MDDARDREPERVLLAVLGAVIVGLPLAITQLEVSPHRFTPGTAVVSALLLIGAVAAPALLFSRWQAAEPSLEQRRR
ncbi:hypothetical protein [Natronolimnobius baerhuensis]|uniref:Uncharacterized protein n=1 Tax=Natronolimnobius baerhuensis TaxID=253108 RepID=A0A202EAG7_9EURY|nr:hypothetical protein [Natronolimnobius baerhuensis]OVE85266.1 hypothetical protein B2G88_00075 [Natronolimnobius baerhuensis]